MKESEKYLKDELGFSTSPVQLATEENFAEYAKLYAAEMIREFVEQNIGIQNWQFAAETFIKNHLKT